MTLKSKILVAAGLVALLSGAAPVYAQEDLSAEDFLISFDGDNFDMPPMPSMAVLPGGSPGFRPSMGNCPMGGGNSFAVLQGDLALSDEQSEKIYTLKNQFLDKIGPKFIAIRSQERHLRDLLSSPKPDRAKITELQNKINADNAFIASAKTENKLAAMEVLTEGQREALRKEMIKSNCGGGGRGKMRMHKGPGGGPRP